jgi:glycosyltransferase involved in cell wall biosynthesis
LIVVGPSGWGPAFEKQEGVVLIGQIPDAVLASLYERALMLVYVPFNEGFGLPPVEAMRVGLPVVASKVPSILGAAMEVDPRNVESIATAISTVATDEHVRDELRQLGLVRTSQSTWLRAAISHVEMWKELM